MPEPEEQLSISLAPAFQMVVKFWNQIHGRHWLFPDRKRNTFLSKTVRLISPFLFCRTVVWQYAEYLLWFFFLLASKSLTELSGRQEGSYALKYHYFYVHSTGMDRKFQFSCSYLTKTISVRPFFHTTKLKQPWVSSASWMTQQFMWLGVF